MSILVAFMFLVSLALGGAMLVALIVALVSAWRMMRAHEALADAARKAVTGYSPKSGA